MTSPAPAASARAWRARLRAGRRRAPVGDVLANLYTALIALLVYGGVFAYQLNRLLATSSGLAAGRNQWLALATLLALLGLAWHGLRAVGPLLATPAEQAWGLSAPVDRRGWLLPRFVLVLGAAAAAGAATAWLLALLALHGLGSAAALLGAGAGLACAAGAVLAQSAAARRDVTGGALLAGAGGVALLTLAGAVPLRPLPPAAFYAAAVAASAMAGAAAVRAYGALPRLDRVALGAGAEMAAAVTTAVVAVDVSLLGRVREVRRWRAVGQVEGGGFRAAPRLLPPRPWALLQAEARRAGRRPSAFFMWGGLLLAQFAVALVMPTLAGVKRILGAYLAAGAFAAGLRGVAASPALRRTLGGSDRALLLAHLALPALAASLWWGATLPTAPAGFLEPVLLAGVVLAAFRAATRPPLAYDVPPLFTPFGPVPVDLLRQVLRGPDVLGAVILLFLLLQG